MTYRASRAGARIREVPITFHDRRVGQSKMSRRIVVEALVVVVQLRVEELVGRLRRRSTQARANRPRPPRFGRRRPPAAPGCASSWMSARSRSRPARPGRRPTSRGCSAAFDADPRPGESFAFLLASDEDDPTTRFERLEVIGRRLMPPTRLLRSAALTIDPFILRGASVGAAWRAERGGAGGAVYHAAGGGLPIASRLPTVVTLLDLAPWEMPEAFQRGPMPRFGQRLRGRLLRDASAVLVGTDAVARAARRLLHLRASRVRVIPLAARPSFAAGPVALAARAAEARAITDRLGLGTRYLAYIGRHDVRHDVGTMVAALADLARAGRPAGLPDDADWPPRVLVLDATPDDRASLARIGARHGGADQLVYAPILLVGGHRRGRRRGARRAAAGRLRGQRPHRLDALAAGVPVIGSAVGALPEIVGTGGILVEPRDRERLAAAIATMWADDAVRARLVAPLTSRRAGRTAATRARSRTWADVADDVRAVYAEVGRPPS